MTFPHQLFFSFLLALAGMASGSNALAQFPAPTVGPVVTTAHVRAELIAHAPEGVAPGAPVWLGLRLAHQPEWHTYWKNPGDSGLPTELQFSLPAGLYAGAVDWPVPAKIAIGTLANYGYEDQVLLPVPLRIDPQFQPRPGQSHADIKLKASWLVCRLECIPEDGEFALRLPLHGATALHAAEFAAAQAAAPVALAQPGQVEIVDGRLQVQLDGLPAAVRGKTLEFFPEMPEIIHTAAQEGKDWTQSWNGERWQASLPLDAHRSASPRDFPFVLALGTADRQPGQPIGWRADAPVRGDWPASATRAAVSPALQAALASNAAAAPVTAPAPSASFWLALVGALIGGLLLNLMPCVFPVLAIKVLSFARHSQDRRANRVAALAYTGGVLASVLALAGLMLALRAAGAQLGWGFQLQSPAVVAALAALFTLIGLNLAGVFEFGNFAPAALRSAESRHPVLNDFLSGVLAVVVASPCSAPFMGASLGLAIALPAPQALLLFGALGLGLALPYLLAGFVPAIARLLPKPGAWMDTLRRLLAFPMFGTVVWLVWVLGQQSGIDGAGALLALLVCLAAVVWALTLHGRTRWLMGAGLLVLSALLASAVGPSLLASPVDANASTPVAANARWQPWSAERVAQLQAEGRPVFIDFTAAWCVTCQFNKSSTLADAQVLADFDAKKVALLRADWTRRDPAISAALAALGRNGVPVYVLQVPGQAPQVLTEILSKDQLRGALASL